MIILSFYSLLPWGLSDLLFHRSNSGICWLSQNPIQWVLLDKFHVSLLSGHFIAKKICFVLSRHITGPIYYCLVNKLYFIILFARKQNLPLSLNLVYCSHYLVQKV